MWKLRKQMQTFLVPKYIDTYIFFLNAKILIWEKNGEKIIWEDKTVEKFISNVSNSTKKVKKNISTIKNASTERK